MRHTVWLPTLLGCTCIVLAPLAAGHGGTYRGPGDTVPPGGGGAPSSPSGPTSGGGSGPSTPSTPSPAGPGSPGGALGGAPGDPVSGGGDDFAADLTSWSFWWEFNKDPYLNLKARLNSGGVQTGSDDFYLGQGMDEEARDLQQPSEQTIRGLVVPALLEALEQQTSNEILSGALIALAKIGDARSEGGESSFEGHIRSFLDDGNLEISETAIVALGILGQDSSVPILTDLLFDTALGRKAVGSTEVGYRKRAFAAYGLALIGGRTTSAGLRQDIVRALCDMLLTDQTSTRDVKVACIIALGMVPLATSTPPPQAESGTPPSAALASSSPIALIDFLLQYLLDEHNPSLVRAHAPGALARLCARLPQDQLSRHKARIVPLLLEHCAPHSRESVEVVQSCVLALGAFGDSDGDELDLAVRERLLDQGAINDQQARRFSLIALAQVGARPGDGPPAPMAGDVSSALLRSLARGADGLRPWTALAMGVYGHERNTRNLPVSGSFQQALCSRFADAGNPEELSAYAIGLGLLGAQEAEAPLLAALDELQQDGPLGYCAVGLGLLNSPAAKQPILELVKASRYRPELLKQSAIALGLLGDQQVVELLLTMLDEARSVSSQAAIASALGFIGDQRSLAPLVALLRDETKTERARGFAAVALGIVADKGDLPWNSGIACDLNYRAATRTLHDEAGTGILNIL